MEKQDTRHLIDELQRTLRAQLEQLDAWAELPEALLRQRPSPDRWSALEIMEHMNLSSGHYFRRLERLYANENNNLRFRTHYVPGRWGEFSTSAMRPKADRSIGWRMRTMAMFEPRLGPVTEVQSLDELRSMLHGFIGLLERARTRGLEGEKVTSTLGPILRFKVGDAFRFPIAHQERHFLQIERTLEQVRAQTPQASGTV